MIQRIGNCLALVMAVGLPALGASLAGAEDALKLTVAPKTEITSVDSRHPEVVRAHNGDLVVVFSGAEGKGHDLSRQHIMCVVSSDDGASWSKPINVYPPDGSDRAFIKDPYLIVAPNGDIVCSYANPARKNTGSYSISTDNGRTWTFIGLISPGFVPPCRRFTGGDVVRNTIYACGEAFDWSKLQNEPDEANLPVSFWKSTDNGRIWQCVREALDDLRINEWDVLALTETHFIAVARRYPTNGETLFFETKDGGKRWSTPVDISGMTGIVHDPNLDWLNREHGTIILHGRRKRPGVGDRSALWLSRDGGATWTHYTPVTDRDTRDEYSGFAGDRGKACGYLVWGENATLFGCTVREETK